MNSPDTKITRYKKFHIYSILNKVHSQIEYTTNSFNKHDM